MPKFRIILYLLTPILLIISCNKEEGHLSVSEMEDVLYDLHMSQAMAQQAPQDSMAYYQQLYRDLLLRKHGLTAEELESNLQYYCTNADLMFAIYEHLSQRLEAQGSAGLGLSFTTDGDTTNLWTASAHILLSQAGRNAASFCIHADSLVAPGDRLEWRMISDAIYPEGDRSALTSIRMEYQDSSCVFTRRIGGYGSQSIEIPLSTQRQLHNIYFSILQNTSWAEKPKLLYLSNIYLLRIRPHQEKPHEPQDSLIQIADSLRKDSIPADR